MGNRDARENKLTVDRPTLKRLYEVQGWIASWPGVCEKG